MKKRSKKNSGLVWIFIAIIAIGGVSAWFLLGNKKELDHDNNNNNENNNNEVPVKKISIVDGDKKTRPYAVMINNLALARPYQSGLQDAYLVYEIIVEGGITRMLALFQNQDNARVGSIRSARHYYLDYAMENDAIYVHHGQSPQALADISKYKVNTISPDNASKAFYRDKTLNVSSEHTSFASLSSIKDVVASKNYRTTMNQDYLLNYVADEIDLSKDDNATVATNIKINYSNSYVTSYVYDSVGKVYKRVVGGKDHIDYETKKQYTVKNIITYKVKNVTLNDGENKGRQELQNIGEGSGYYITNGYAIPIKWSKSARDKQTKYTTIDGKEINVNDGNTFIQIQPSDQTLSIS